jgi:hypothetical protein
MKRFFELCPHEPRAIDNFEGFSHLVKSFRRQAIVNHKNNSEGKTKKIPGRNPVVSEMNFYQFR